MDPQYPYPTIPSVWTLFAPRMFKAAGVYVVEESRFLFALRTPKPGEERMRLQVTLVGGGMKDEDPSLTAAATREAAEETGAGLHIYQSPRTLVVQSATDYLWVRVQAVERPAAVVFRNNNTPPGDPFCQRFGNRGCMVLFLGELLRPPRPGGEHPAFVWLSIPQMMLLAQQDVPLADLLAEGMPLTELWEGALPRTATLRLTDSQEALILALGPAVAPRFFASLLAAASRSTS